MGGMYFQSVHWSSGSVYHRLIDAHTIPTTLSNKHWKTLSFKKCFAV